LQKTQSFPGPVSLGPAPLRLAAFGDAKAQANNFLNGDLAMPVIYNKVLSQSDIQARFDQQSDQLHYPQGVQPPALDSSVLGCWPLSEEQGSNVADISLSVPPRPGLIINHATWQIGGPSFKPGPPNVPQFGNYDPSKDPTRGHGLRFASDDLFDCRWQVTQTYTVPANARSGVYVARLSYTHELAADATQHASLLPCHLHCAAKQPAAGAHPAGVPNQYLAGLQLKTVSPEAVPTNFYSRV